LIDPFQYGSFLADGGYWCSLNDVTRDLMNEVLLSWFQGWTIIAVAHQLKTILEFDMVAVLEDGRLVEYGEPKHLLERQESTFRRLFQYPSVPENNKTR
jgi:ATP-binding cassette, subfamily C (CFTR/MRP), member 1